MDIVEALHEPIGDCHAWFEATLSDVTSEQAHWNPPGVANSIAAVYAHAVLGADFALHTLLQERPPLMAAGEWTAAISELPPAGPWGDWARRVRLDLGLFRRYARAIYASWDAYLGALTPGDLDRVVDLSMWEMGTRSLAQFLSMQVEHFSCHTGEIACLKGLQGAVGFVAGRPDGKG